MDIQDLHSPPPLSSASSSSSSSSLTSDLHPLSIGAERWQIAEKTTQQLLSVIQPTAYSEKRRKEIIEYIHTLIDDSFGIKVFPFGSVPLKTYLPDGDIDLTAVSNYHSEDLAANICNLLKYEERNNTRIQVKDALCVPAQVRVVKCTVGNIAVDISFNQTAGLCALCFLEQVDQFIGKDHLFKRSVILIKAWCYYESRILGGFHGLISTYALETLVLHVINHFHSSLHFPLAVLYKFLGYYSTFDWEAYIVGINGLVLISSLPGIEVQLPSDSDEVLLTDDYLRNSRDAFSSYTGFIGSGRPAFAVKFLNILDPLRDDNNLGRSVSKGNFYRIKSALSYGTDILGDILTLAPEKIRVGLEKFFINTLERNGRGSRADVIVSVPQFGSEICSTNNTSDDFLAGVQYGLWFHDYGMIDPLKFNRSATPTVWNNGWIDIGQNVQCDQNMYYNVDEGLPSLVDCSIHLHLANVATLEKRGKSRGTGTYIPLIKHYPQKDIDLQKNRTEEKSGKVVQRHSSLVSTQGEETTLGEETTPGEGGHRETAYPDEGGHRETTYCDENGSSCVFDFSAEEFPLLPGSKPIPIKINQLVHSQCDHVDETFASLDSLEFGGLKYSSLRSVSFSEPGKQSDSDVSFVLDTSNDQSVAVEDNLESSNSEEKMVVPVQLVELTDVKEFPPLSRPEKPVITLNKKEFPSLRASLRSERKSNWRKNNSRGTERQIERDTVTCL